MESEREFLLGLETSGALVGQQFTPKLDIDKVGNSAIQHNWTSETRSLGPKADWPTAKTAWIPKNRIVGSPGW